MRWRQMEAIERVVIVAYFVVLLVLIGAGVHSLLTGERATWSIFTLVLCNIAFLVWTAYYRRQKAKRDRS